MRIAVNNYAGKSKLNEDIQDLILSEEVCRRDAGETSSSSSTLNLETRDRGQERNSSQGRSKSKKGRSKSSL
jgi:hypothetical protein